MTFSDSNVAYHARRAVQEAVLAAQAPPGAARDAHRTMCLHYSRQVIAALRPQS